MKKQLILGLTLFMLAACETPPVRRAQMIAEHPEWDKQTVKIIQEGYLLQGMTTDQVKAAWGGPCWTCVGTVKDKERKRWMAWEYPTQIVFFDENERVIRWTQK